MNEEAASIDVIKDVIDATCIRWVCETLVSSCVTFSSDVDFTPRNSTILLSKIVQCGECQIQRKPTLR